MRIVAYLEKTFKENLREWKILIMTLVFAPFFVYLMYGYFGAASPVYKLIVANHDGRASSADSTASVTHGLVASWRSATHPDGTPVFKVSMATNLDEATAKIRNRDADLLVEIPGEFSRSLEAFRSRSAQTPARLVNHTDAGNPRSSMAMAFSDYIAYAYAVSVTDAPLPLDVSIRNAGSPRALSEFDLYVPALLVLAIIMVLFTAAASLLKEVDKGTMTRLRLSRLTSAELLTAVSLNQVLIGTVALALAFLAAVSVGYHSEGSLVAILVVGAVATLGVMAISVITAAFLTTIFELLTIGVFPFFVLMFLSECMFPLPKITIGQIAGNTVYANDALPTSLAVRAFNKILNLGAGLGDITFELAAMGLLAAVYYAIGIWLFYRRHQRV